MTLDRVGHRYRDVESLKTIDVWFSSTNERVKRSCLAEKVGVIESDFVEVNIQSVLDPPKSIEDAFLRLHLLSERIYKPNTINLDGIFSLLNNVAWTSAGPVLPGRINDLRRLIESEYHHLSIPSVDKFPRMTDYIIPSDVRIGDADRVRLGAHLAPGTTVMHEGFVNFNAGTLGKSMIEGRVTPGVIIDENSDVGAGASIMGTLSGGGKQTISVGKNSLIGANAGIGISLGDECIVEAGLYVTAGTKIKIPSGDIVSARELSGQSYLLYRRNSQTGAVEALPTDSSRWGGLNVALHGND